MGEEAQPAAREGQVGPGGESDRPIVPTKPYRPQAVRRVYIPKPDGKQRPLGIPTVKDRVVQTAAVLVLEPIFEADLPPEQHAYRAGRGALEAVKKVHALLNTGHMEVVDADLSGYFDSVPHAELMKSVARRIVDRWMLRLVKMWLTMPVGEEALRVMRGMMERLKLTVNETKTRLCRAPEEAFDFLGYTLGWCHSPKTGRRYIGTRPSRKRIGRMCQAIHEATDRRTMLQEVRDKVEELNRMLRGWANYFCLGPVSKAYRVVDAHARKRLRQWLCGKHRRPGHGTRKYPDTYLYGVLGLIRLESRTRDLPWAKA